jgi:EEF1A lysine methyltransferase 4
MPDFASHEYWQSRFQKNGSVFDWLISAKDLSGIIQDNLDENQLRKAEILHAGCGTADSVALGDLVENAAQVHNVDYSQAAIDAASARKKESPDLTTSDAEPASATDRHDSILHAPSSKNTMRWSCLDLLSLESTLALLDQQAGRGSLYDLVIDKSTSDSISCGSNVTIQLPYLLSINGWTRAILQSGVTQNAEVHPLHILAVHLAALTKPKTGKWIVVSYSDDRFPFLPPFARSASHGFLSDSVIQAGFPHPQQLWRLENKQKIDLNEEETLAQRRRRLSSGPVHRPQVSHWLYVLVRTDAAVTD